jgi:UDP-2,3-diacylglucosamine hydrolase
MKDIFIADAHLKDPSDESYIRLLSFLKQNRGRIRTLVLLGDIFEFWIGFRHCVYSAYLPLLHELCALKKAGTDIVMVEGNHDFNVGSFFTHTLEAKVIPNGDCITLGKTRIWVEHGDLINPTRTYLWLRNMFRSRALRFAGGFLHPDLLWSVAEYLGKWSKQQRQGGESRAAHLSPPHNGHSWSIPEEKIIQAAALYHDTTGCSALVCGHFHHSWEHISDNVRILAVGAWGNTGIYAEHRAGEFSFRCFAPASKADPRS